MTEDAWTGPPCEKCKGKGEIVFTRGNRWSSIRCWDCQGTGLANTPSPGLLYEEREYNEERDGALPPISDHPAVREADVCGICLGQGVIISKSLVELPCPTCAGDHSVK